MTVSSPFPAPPTPLQPASPDPQANIPAAHTPEPWLAYEFSNHPTVGVESDEFGDICDVVLCRRDRGVDIANAKLIRAAPKLLRACRAIIAAAEDRDADLHDLLHDQEANVEALVRAAIDLATILPLEPAALTWQRLATERAQLADDEDPRSGVAEVTLGVTGSGLSARASGMRSIDLPCHGGAGGTMGDACAADPWDGLSPADIAQGSRLGGEG